MSSKIQSLNIWGRLPVIGILAFSLCSTWALYHLFVGNAAHPTGLYWLPAVATELVTAWLVYQVVAMVRRVTDTKAAKRDRRFYGIMLGALLALCVPTLGASVWANTREFGHLLLGLLFPAASVACAFAVAIPSSVAMFEKELARQRQEAERQRRERERARQAAAERGKMLANLGKERETLEAVRGNPMATHGEIAAMVGISRRTVGNHLERLEGLGLIRRNGDGVEIL